MKKKKKMSESIDVLKSRIKELEETVHTLEETIHNLEEKIITLETEIEDINEENNNLYSLNKEERFREYIKEYTDCKSLAYRIGSRGIDSISIDYDLIAIMGRFYDEIKNYSDYCICDECEIDALDEYIEKYYKSDKEFIIDYDTLSKSKEEIKKLIGSEYDYILTDYCEIPVPDVTKELTKSQCNNLMYALVCHKTKLWENGELCEYVTFKRFKEQIEKKREKMKE